MTLPRSSRPNFLPGRRTTVRPAGRADAARRGRLVPRSRLRRFRRERSRARASKTIHYPPDTILLGISVVHSEVIRPWALGWLRASTSIPFPMPTARRAGARAGGGAAQQAMSPNPVTTGNLTTSLPSSSTTRIRKPRKWSPSCAGSAAITAACRFAASARVGPPLCRPRMCGHHR
jgi:hypothetical protein